MTAATIERSGLQDGETPNQPNLVEQRMQEVETKIFEVLTAPGSENTPDEFSFEAAAELLETDANLLTWAVQAEDAASDTGDEKRNTLSSDELLELNSKPYLRSVWVGEVGRSLEASMGDVLDAAKDQGLSPDIPYNPAGGKGHELLGYYDLDQIEIIKAAIKAKRLAAQVQPPEEPEPEPEPQPEPAPEPAATSEPEPQPEPAASKPKPPRAVKPTRPPKPKPKPAPKSAPAPKAEAKPQSLKSAQLPTGHIPLNKVLEVVDEQTDIGPALFLQSMRKLGIEPKELPGGQTGGGPVPYIAEDHVAQVLLHAKQNRTGVPVKDQ